MPKLLFFAAWTAAALLYGAEPIVLPPPETGGGRPLMETLAKRRSTREFSEEALSLQTLSNLLWAAFGVNRPATGGRTAPSAWNHQEIDIYLFTPDGVYLYIAFGHRLDKVLDGDRRGAAGSPEFARAPVSLVYVADHSRSPRTPVWEKEKYAYVSTGFIGQNVYLFGASEGLGTVIHDSADKGALSRLLGLGPGRQIILAQAVGRPK